MVGEALVARHAVFGAADRPIEYEARDHVGMGHCKRRHRRTAHAAAHQKGPRNVQMVEQSFALRDVMRPGHGLEAAAGLTAFAAVEQDAGVGLRQMVEELDLGVDALRRPSLDHGVKTARRVHQDRRPGADDFIMRRDAVDVDARHAQPLIWRPARASAISAPKAPSVALAELK